MLEGKKVWFFWQSGRLLANQSDTQAAVNYCTIFHPGYSSELREIGTTNARYSAR
jgi:hypothetical protein